MKFNDFPYERPDLDDFLAKVEKLLVAFEKAESFEEQSEIFEINE